MRHVNTILDYWFEGLDEDTKITNDSVWMKKWFAKDKNNDHYIKKTFEKDVINASLGKYKDWEESVEGRLALIILLDQFSRHIYRGKSQAFENDLTALELSFRSIKDGTVDRLRLIERTFLYLPLMHSENIEIQEMSVKCFEKILNRAQEEEDINVEFFQNSLNYAQRHFDAIRQFKRFPHRNKILKRRSTSDEIIYLQDPKNNF